MRKNQFINFCFQNEFDLEKSFCEHGKAYIPKPRNLYYDIRKGDIIYILNLKSRKEFEESKAKKITVFKCICQNPKVKRKQCDGLFYNDINICHNLCNREFIGVVYQNKLSYKAFLSKVNFEEFKRIIFSALKMELDEDNQTIVFAESLFSREK